MAQKTNPGGSPLPQNLEFLMLSIGQSRASPRSAVRTDVVDLLRPIVRAKSGSFAGWDIRILSSSPSGAGAFELRRNGRLLSTCYVAWTDEGSVEIWQIARTHDPLPGRAACRQPLGLPWAAAVLMVTEWDADFRSREDADDYMQAMREMGDLERCLAWMIIEEATHSRTEEPAATIGDPTEVPNDLPILPADGVHLGIGPEGLLLTVQLSKLSTRELATLQHGRLDLGILSSGSSGIMLLRYDLEDGRRPLIQDAPWHIGLLPAHRRCLAGRAEGELHVLSIVIQDETGRQLGGRMLTLTAANCNAIEQIVRRQAEEASEPGWTRSRHDREIAQFYQRYPDPHRTADRLFERAHSRQTVH